MSTERTTRRYEMVNVRPGYLMIEQENHTLARRSYFAAEKAPPLEEYREGNQFWKPQEAAQTFQFDVRDLTTGDRAAWRAGGAPLLRLLRTGQHRPSDGRPGARPGDLALRGHHDQAWRDGLRPSCPHEKVRVLNALFNGRLTRPGKKVLILPDLFGLQRQITYEQVAINFGLASMD